ncbi:MAG: hypothetical protein ACYC42_01610 [Lysobacter sp.]
MTATQGRLGSLPQRKWLLQRSIGTLSTNRDALRDRKKTAGSWHLRRRLLLCNMARARAHG